MPLEQIVDNKTADSNGAIFYNGKKVEQEMHIDARDIYGLMGSLFLSFKNKRLAVRSIDINPENATVTVNTGDGTGHPYHGRSINSLQHTYHGLREIGISYIPLLQ